MKVLPRFSRLYHHCTQIFRSDWVLKSSGKLTHLVSHGFPCLHANNCAPVCAHILYQLPCRDIFPVGSAPRAPVGQSFIASYISPSQSPLVTQSLICSSTSYGGLSWHTSPVLLKLCSFKKFKLGKCKPCSRKT